jgi:6,7-dimethyl-8-ribityllumazine synthase
MKSDRNTSVPAIPGARPRVLIVEARFYDDIADQLLAGARAVLEVAGADIDVVTVPGALEIPAVVAMAQRAPAEVPDFVPYDGYVVLGCVIRGETTHYDVVAGESNRALMTLAVRDGLALGNGILTVETTEQALARAKPAEMDKGGGAARACLVMIATQRRFGLSPVPVDPFDMFDEYDDTPDARSMLDDIIGKAGGKRSKR